MSPAAAMPKLTREKIRRLVRAARNIPAPDKVNIESTEYDWNQPHHFNPEHLISLEIFSKKMAAQFTKTFETLCTGEFQVATAQTRQFFACALNDIVSLERQDHYFLPFMNEETEDVGFIGISPQTAVILVGQMLRETEPDDSGEHILSELEEMILLDLISSLADSVASLFTANGFNMKRSGKVKKSGWPVDLPSLEDLTAIDFKVTSESVDVSVNFVIRSTVLDPIVGLDDHKGIKLTPKQTSDLIMKQAHKAPVEVVGQLSASTIYLRDLLDLVPGDLILLRKKITEPLDILINNRPILQGYPVACMGKHALIIDKNTAD